ncbi:MAG: acyl-CoA dehydrogenase [Bacillus thermozeamaize]|uniref:Acyl-CoA dehydrogenase n=1 Tax=Bacillus thermozeamaize TaxID=230954 RepID=A0A1Y3PB91_9BACI|nr:MAG: acyl-CoA dehydrogenase [Bacillus thermozeamaize]
MDFALNSEQEMFQQTMRQYLESKGGTGLARQYMEGQREVLRQLWTGMAELGFMGVNVPEQYGGLGQGPLSLVPILEELGRVVAPGLYPETMALAVPLLEMYGSEEQKQRYLSDIAEGKRMVTLACHEPPAGRFAAGDIQMTAKKEGEDYILNGAKTLVPHGDQADTLIVLARTAQGSAESGLTLFLVDRETAGLSARVLKSFDQTRDWAEVQFHEVRFPQSQRLGPEQAGWVLLQEGLKHLHVALCATMVGGMAQAVEMSTEYAKTRKQFGQPIGRFQAIKHRIVEMKLDLESARSLTYYAAWALENGAPDQEAAIYSARAMINESYIRVAGHNIQNHGGMGFTWEYDCHLYIKRARALENYLGSPSLYREKAAVALGW